MGIINEARAKATLALMAKGSTIPAVEIGVVPVNWEHFPGTNDLWCSVTLPESMNTSGCIYRGKAGSVFPPHKHVKRRESIQVMNPGGKIKIVTETNMFLLEYPNSHSFEPGEIHAVKFITQSDLMVLWSPKMDDGFDNDFIHHDDINVTPAKT